jgi:hypothetical protein
MKIPELAITVGWAWVCENGEIGRYSIGSRRKNNLATTKINLVGPSGWIFEQDCDNFSSIIKYH